MREHWLKMIRDSEKRTDTFLSMQIRDRHSDGLGAISVDFGYPDPKLTLFCAATALSVYLNPESRYRGDNAVIEAFDLALGYAERKQNPDGTFDYTPCNFRSGPDTAFIVNRVVTTYDLLVRAASDPALAPLAARLKALILKAGDGMAQSGFHTPNHRWALASALSSCWRISGDERYRTAADRYLVEGIDGNAEGEYAERSAGNYNMVNNEQMLILSSERNDGSYLGYVERNLEMMLSYVDPDGSVFTNNSTRQDRGVKVWLDAYYFEYLVMSKKMKKPLFASVARRIMDDITDAGRSAPDYLDRIMLELDGNLDYGDATAPIPTDYERFYRDSGIVRVRRGDFGFSLIKGTGRFLYFQSGGVTAFLKLGVAYFDKREFKAASLEREGGAYLLRFTAKGWYYLPFEEKPETSDWWKMDQSKRKKTEGPDLEFTVAVSERTQRDGIDVRVAVGGWQGVPIRFEIGLTPGVVVESEAFAEEGMANGAVLVRSGILKAHSGLSAMAIGPAFAEHGDIGGTYGSESRSRDHFTAYFTAFSPMDKLVSFRRVPTVERSHG